MPAKKKKRKAAGKRTAKKPNPNAGVSRINQPEKRTFGFFVRLMRNGIIYNAFFADKSYGGKSKALAAARLHYQKLVRQHGPTTRKSRAKVVRRLSKSGIYGVRHTVVETSAGPRAYWIASWSPRAGQVKRKMFSVAKFGAKKAKAMAVRARAEGVRTMEE